MIVKNIIDEDFVNYKKSSMFIIFPKCSFKCCIEAGNEICQNMEVMKQPNINISYDSIIKRYITNPITQAIVCGGLEPFDSFDDLVELIRKFRIESNDDIVIYTGYTEDELVDQLKILATYNNIIIKFGRFIPNREKHLDKILGVTLASDNQYAKKIS